MQRRRVGGARFGFAFEDAVAARQSGIDLAFKAATCAPHRERNRSWQESNTPPGVRITTCASSIRAYWKAGRYRKGPGLEPGQKRLAVKVEDHPLEYGDFEGVIPPGEYGAGTVMLWDRGRCRVRRRRSDRLDFELEGHKLRGVWSLLRMGGRAGEDGRSWLLIRRSERSPVGDAADDASPAVRMDASVATGRTMEQIRAHRKRVRPASAGKDLHDLPDLNSIAGVRRAPLPRDPRPQLATPAGDAPEGDDWIHEIKFDG